MGVLVPIASAVTDSLRILLLAPLDGAAGVPETLTVPVMVPRIGVVGAESVTVPVYAPPEFGGATRLPSVTLRINCDSLPFFAETIPFESTTVIVLVLVNWSG